MVNSQECLPMDFAKIKEVTVRLLPHSVEIQFFCQSDFA